MGISGIRMLLKTSFRILNVFGISLADQVKQARKDNISVSVPHFYVDAITNGGWTDDITLEYIGAAMKETGSSYNQIADSLAWFSNKNIVEIQDWCRYNNHLPSMEEGLADYYFMKPVEISKNENIG